MKEIEDIVAEINNHLSIILEFINSEEDDDAYCDAFCKFIMNNMNKEEFIVAVKKFFKQEKDETLKELFISVVLGSEIDIFVSWFKDCLKIATKDACVSLRNVAKDILLYYKESFAKVI